MTFAADLSGIDSHRNTPDVSLERHMRKKRLQLGMAVTSVQRIYLDQRFWILLRDVSIGRSQDKTISELLIFLKASVAAGKAICPISESVFIELLKQSDLITRISTAELIDELSLGVTLIPFHERISQELCNSFYEQSGAKDLIPVEHLVWTKLIHVLGESHPSNMPFSAADQLAIQKAFSDHIWKATLVQMIERLDTPMPKFDWDELAERLNTGIREHQSSIRSYEQAFRAEFEGGLSLFHDVIDKLLYELHERGYKDFGKDLIKLSHKKQFDVFSKSIPTLHIHSSCHAAVRWNQGRNLCGNDLFDFHHAESALAYCSVFLTEKPLSVMLNQQHLGLSKYKCQIFCSAVEGLNWLRNSDS
jgi:hypothetical protein